MSNDDKPEVSLSFRVPYITLPEGPAEVFCRIHAAGYLGVSSDRLISEGFVSFPTLIEELRGMGALIDTEWRPIPEWKDGEQLGATYYTYAGWALIAEPDRSTFV